MQYLDLVNMAIRESGKELNELTSVNFDTVGEGQRLYPRLKRYVSQAWKRLQMARNQWEFGVGEATTVINPRLKFQSGSGTTAPTAGTVLTGEQSGFSITVGSILEQEGTWAGSDASGQIEFTVSSGNSRVAIGETFSDLGDLYSFTYTGPGSYALGDIISPPENAPFAEPQWSTFMGSLPNYSPIPINYIPWENWLYKGMTYVEGTKTSPAYLSQDPTGRVVFYPQTLTPFWLNFVYAIAPQEMADYDDVPFRLPPAYHEWIAWEALITLATFDRDSGLAAHCSRQAAFFRNRAELNLMPLVCWSDTTINE